MEALLTSENMAIVVLAAWVIEMKFTIKYYRNRATEQWSAIAKFHTSINAVRNLLQMKLEEDDE